MEKRKSPIGFLVVLPGEIIEIPQDSDKSWLTLFYSLPRELAEKWKPAYDLPRCPYEVLRTDKYDHIVCDDVVKLLVWDCYAWSAWQFFIRLIFRVCDFLLIYRFCPRRFIQFLFPSEHHHALNKMLLVTGFSFIQLYLDTLDRDEIIPYSFIAVLWQLIEFADAVEFYDVYNFPIMNRNIANMPGLPRRNNADAVAQLIIHIHRSLRGLFNGFSDPAHKQLKALLCISVLATILPVHFLVRLVLDRNIVEIELLDG